MSTRRSTSVCTLGPWAEMLRWESQTTPTDAGDLSGHLADEARAGGELALIVPSAALPGTRMLVLLGPRVLIPWLTEPLDIDVDVSADRAGPPLAVLPHVRWRGTPHAGLDAWRAGGAATLLHNTRR